MTKSREVILRLTIHHDNPMALRLFGMEVAPVCQYSRVFFALNA